MLSRDRRHSRKVFIVKCREEVAVRSVHVHLVCSSSMVSELKWTRRMGHSRFMLPIVKWGASEGDGHHCALKT